MISVPTLTHGEVTVRPVRMRDSHAISRLLKDNREWLKQWEATVPHSFTAPPARHMIKSVLRLARQDQVAPFVIEYRGRVVGQITLSGISFGSLASGAIGYWVAESAAGKGITPSAVALVTDWAFTTLGIHRVEVCIRPENIASLRVVRKLGMRYEGLRRRYIHIDGDWRDHFCFAVTGEEAISGMLARLTRGTANESLADIPEVDQIAARTPVR
jgi:ribosomal-protein-alanine N-acetyltransferase